MKTHIALALALVLAAPASAEESWYPSKYGKDDQIGAANNLSAEGVKRAAGLVTSGKVYQLGGVTGPNTPALAPRFFKLVITPLSDGSGATLGSNQATFNDDFLVTWLGIGTQLDGFGHAGFNHRYYNGAPVADVFGATGLKKYGTDKIPPIVTRGVLLDMAKHFKKDMLKEGTAINQKEIDAAAKAQGVAIEKGDVVLLHTGWQKMAGENPQRFLAGQPGIGLQGAEYLAGLGVVAIGADTVGLEVSPGEDKTAAYPVHPTLLAKHGVYILENIQTAELAADKTYTFLFVLGIPRFEGTVQAVINPVAIR